MYIPCLLLTITLCFTCGERRIWSYIKNISKYYDHDFLQHFLLIFMSLLTARIVKNSHILARYYFIVIVYLSEKTP